MDFGERWIENELNNKARQQPSLGSNSRKCLLRNESKWSRIEAKRWKFKYLFKIERHFCLCEKNRLLILKFLLLFILIVSYLGGRLIHRFQSNWSALWRTLKSGVRNTQPRHTQDKWWETDEKNKTEIKLHNLSDSQYATNDRDTAHTPL